MKCTFGPPGLFCPQNKSIWTNNAGWHDDIQVTLWTKNELSPQKCYIRQIFQTISLEQICIASVWVCNKFEADKNDWSPFYYYHIHKIIIILPDWPSIEKDTCFCPYQQMRQTLSPDLTDEPKLTHDKNQSVRKQLKSNRFTELFSNYVIFCFLFGPLCF